MIKNRTTKILLIYLIHHVEQYGPTYLYCIFIHILVASVIATI